MREGLFVWGNYGEDGKFVRHLLPGGGYGMIFGDLPSNIDSRMVMRSGNRAAVNPNWIGWWEFPLERNEYVGTKFGIIRVGSPHLLRTIVEDDLFVLTEKVVDDPLLLTLGLDAKAIINGHGHGRFKTRPALGAFKTEELRVVTVRVETTYTITDVETPHVCANINNLEG